MLLRRSIRWFAFAALLIQRMEISRVPRLPTAQMRLSFLSAHYLVPLLSLPSSRVARVLPRVVGRALQQW